MVLKEEAQTTGRVGAVRDLRNAKLMANHGAVADGLADESAKRWDERMESR